MKTITGPVEYVFYGVGCEGPCRIALSIHEHSEYDNLYLSSHYIESCKFAERCKQANNSVNIYRNIYFISVNNNIPILISKLTTQLTIVRFPGVLINQHPFALKSTDSWFSMYDNMVLYIFFFSITIETLRYFNFRHYYFNMIVFCVCKCLCYCNKYLTPLNLNPFRCHLFIEFSSSR